MLFSFFVFCQKQLDSQQFFVQTNELNAIKLKTAKKKKKKKK